jgi:hypothetical protein
MLVSGWLGETRGLEVSECAAPTALALSALLQSRNSLNAAL